MRLGLPSGARVSPVGGEVPPRHAGHGGAVRRTPRKDRTVTTKSDFDTDDWARIVRAPMMAGLAITLADPGGHGPVRGTRQLRASGEYARLRR